MPTVVGGVLNFPDTGGGSPVSDDGFNGLTRWNGAYYDVNRDGALAPIGSDGSAVIAQLRRLCGLTADRSGSFFHVFDSLNGWIPNSLDAAGASTTWPVVLTTAVDTPFIRSGGTDSIVRGYTSNAAGVITKQKPLTVMLDQTSPWAMACGYRIPLDNGGYFLMGPGDATVGAAPPTGVQVGFEHGTSGVFMCGYKYSGVANTVISTIPLDAEWHVGWVWCDAANGVYKCMVDSENPLTFPNTNTFANVKASMRINFGNAGNGDVAWCAGVWAGSY